jgi:hypothetical protein
MVTRRHLNTLAALLLVSLSGPALALDAPKGRTVLTVSGQITVKNAGDKASFDMAMLEALPQHSFTTRTPWYDKPVRFTGPLLADVLDAVKANGTVLEATALNDYTITIPMTDAREFKVVVARLLNGEPMRVRDKGPLFVIYPFDSSLELRKSVYYERSIWQLKALNVKP